MYYRTLSQLKNAVRAGKERVTLPFSKMDFAVVNSLVEAGFLKSVEKETLGRRDFIMVRLARAGRGRTKGTFSDFKLLSKPSRHIYTDYKKLHPIRQGHGAGVLSTSRGIMTDRDARKNKVGGEYLFQIW